MLRIPSLHIDQIIHRGKITRNDVLALACIRTHQSFAEWTPDLYGFYWQGMKKLHVYLQENTQESDTIDTVLTEITLYSLDLIRAYEYQWEKDYRGPYSHFGINHFYRWLASYEFILLIKHIQHRLECVHEHLTDDCPPIFGDCKHHGHGEGHIWMN